MSFFNFIKFSSTTAGTQPNFPVCFSQPSVKGTRTFSFSLHVPTSGLWSKGLLWHLLFIDCTTTALCRLMTYTCLFVYSLQDHKVKDVARGEVVPEVASSHDQLEDVSRGVAHQDLQSDLQREDRPAGEAYGSFCTPSLSRMRQVRYCNIVFLRSLLAVTPYDKVIHCTFFMNC